jgi:hypothetical protein
VRCPVPPIADNQQLNEDWRVDRTEPLQAFARGLHQDCLVECDDLASLAGELLSYLTSEERAALRNWLAETLQTLTPSEMKGLLNRATTDVRFSSKGAYRLLRATADRLGLA